MLEQLLLGGKQGGVPARELGVRIGEEGGEQVGLVALQIGEAVSGESCVLCIIKKNYYLPYYT